MIPLCKCLLANERIKILSMDCSRPAMGGGIAQLYGQANA